METNSSRILFEKEQYYNQANIVYLSTIVLCCLIVPIQIFIVGSLLAGLLNIGSIIVAIFAFLLNTKKYYGFSSLIFIYYISFLAVVQFLLFGFQSGYQYFFFNMSALIIFTRWKSWQKSLGVAVEIVLFIGAFFLIQFTHWTIELSYEMVVFFHTLNIILNIIGVANSARYYVHIATKYHHKVLNLATRDYLTDIANRTFFDEYWDEVYNNRKNTDKAIGFMILDIDFFKKVNDRFGHLGGDEILKQFALILKENSRKEDFIARYGGEEFAVVTEVSDIEEMEIIAERFRLSIENNVFLYKENEIRITTSIGALFISTNSQSEKKEAFDQTDQLLYIAKEGGRNRVVSDALL